MESNCWLSENREDLHPVPACLPVPVCLSVCSPATLSDSLKKHLFFKRKVIFKEGIALRVQ